MKRVFDTKKATIWCNNCRASICFHQLVVCMSAGQSTIRLLMHAQNCWIQGLKDLIEEWNQLIKLVIENSFTFHLTVLLNPLWFYINTLYIIKIFLWQKLFFFAQCKVQIALWQKFWLVPNNIFCPM